MIFHNILLTGASGKLGSIISRMVEAQNLWTPNSDEFNLTKLNSIESFFDTHDIDAVIHCAALARMSSCEKDPVAAITSNIIGTSNLVNIVIKKESEVKKQIRFVHISSDGVYAGTKGNYSETDPSIPYNKYGWTKLGAECAVNLLSNFCIIRTRFFDPENIPFDESATDLYSSTMPVENLANSILQVLYTDFIGTINIGSPSQSDYDHFKLFKPSLKTCTRDDIIKTLSFQLAKDASLDLSRWHRMKFLFKK